jgi:hypothetical protein
MATHAATQQTNIQPKPLFKMFLLNLITNLPLLSALHAAHQQKSSLNFFIQFAHRRT